MTEHRITIDESLFDDRYIAACTCGDEVYNAPSWEAAYESMTEHLRTQGIPDSEIVLPEQPS